MKKKIVAIVAIIALIAVLGVVLCACNADSYAKKLEKAGYEVQIYSDEDLKDNDDVKVEWGLTAEKVSGLLDIDGGEVIKFKSLDDAKEMEEKAKENGISVKRSGKIVIAGTEDFVKAAK